MTGERMGKTSDAAYLAAMSGDYHQTRMAIAFEMLDRNLALSGATVFDFGCGEGSFMRRLAERGARVAGCDPSPKLLPQGATLGGVEVLEALPENSLDALVALNVLTFMDEDDLARFWPAMRRAVRIGGYFLTCNGSEVAAKVRKWGANPYTFPGELWRRGFYEVEQDFFRYYPLPWTRLLTGRSERIIDRAKLARIPLWLKRRRSTGYFSIARKIKSASDAPP